MYSYQIRLNIPTKFVISDSIELSELEFEVSSIQYLISHN